MSVGRGIISATLPVLGPAAGVGNGQDVNGVAESPVNDGIAKPFEKQMSAVLADPRERVGCRGDAFQRGLHFFVETEGGVQAATALPAEGFLELLERGRVQDDVKHRAARAPIASWRPR
jgi:hypothetical protein